MELTCRRQIIYQESELRCLIWLKCRFVTWLISSRAAPAHYAHTDLALSTGGESLSRTLGSAAHRGKNGGCIHGITRHTNRKVVT